MSEQSKSSPRPSLPVNPKLNQKLAAYMTAASAAGVGMLALAQSTEAKVVYTATNVTLTTPIPIDLNHDGIPDFTLRFGGYLHQTLLDIAPQVTGNAVRGSASQAACGFFGVPVGPGEKFATNSYHGNGVLMADFYAMASVAPTDCGPTSPTAISASSS